MEMTGETAVPSWETIKTVQPETLDLTAAVISNNNNNNNNNNNCEVELLDDNGNENKDEDLNLGDTSNHTAEERNALYQRGLEYERSLKPRAALQCYLGCVQSVKNKNLFAHLPQCLRKISDIYLSQKNYDRAVHFAQAEKLFYETSYFETDKIQEKIEEITGDNSVAAADLTELNMDAMRAEEYEQFARHCWNQKQHHIALEYAGRCTKLRQQIYGNDHEKTRSSFGFFADIFAEIEALRVEHLDVADDSELPDRCSRAPEVIMSSPAGGEPVSILRQRSVDSSKETDREKKQVRFHESVEENLRQREKEEQASLSLKLIHLAVCIMILASVGVWLLCSQDRGQTCQSLMSAFQKWIKAVRLYFYSQQGTRPPA